MQEKELALAANRFAECRKTIESLGQQLKSLATLEDFLLDSENPVESTCQVTQGPQNGGEQLKLHISDLSLPKRDSEPSISLNPSIAFEKSRKSFGRFHPRSKSVSRTRNHWKGLWRKDKVEFVNVVYNYSFLCFRFNMYKSKITFLHINTTAWRSKIVQSK